jgi:O-antigen/teichoic acid export membrane protein
VIVFKNAFWLSICRFAADFSSLLLFAAISRELGPVSTGQYSYAFALCAFISIIAASGLDQYGVREYSRLTDRKDRNALWRAMLLVQVLQLLVGIALLLIAITWIARERADPLVIVELSIFLMGWGLSRTAFIPAMAAESMAAPALIELGCRSAGSLSALALCLGGVSSLPTLLMGFPIAGAAMLILSLRNATQHHAVLSLSASASHIWGVARGVLPFTFCEALGQFYIRADLLLVTQMLGAASAGWYAADLKVVEVGVMPLILLGTAAFPLLSRTAFSDKPDFQRIAHDFLKSVLFVSGWLAVGVFCLVPLVIPLVFGDRFEPAARLLPMFAVLAVVKGLEIAIYRLLYSVQKQTTYLVALAGGSALIWMLNIMLIPLFGTGGAILAVVVSTAVVDTVAIVSLRTHLPLRRSVSALTRASATLGFTYGVYLGLHTLGVNEWAVATAACLAFPLFGVISGLVPHPRRSPLFAHRHSTQQVGVGS